MNDFLQSLRNGQAEKPRTPKTRKNSDTPYQYTNNSRFNTYGGGGYQNTRNHQMKRPQPHGMPHQMGNQIPPEDANTNLLADILDTLSSHVEILVKNQEYMVNIQERTADMLERQAVAIERIVAHLNLSPAMDDLTDGIQDAANAQPAFENHYITSREPEEAADDNRGNSWEPVSAPVVKSSAAPAIKSGLAPTVKPAVKKTKKIPFNPLVKKTDTSKPVLRKRRKVVAKEIIKPSKVVAAKSPASPKESRAPKSSESMKAELMPRDAVMDIIQSMRNEGATFHEVAKRLVDLGQPTFSGRGEWHAQTIHRLCSKK